MRVLLVLVVAACGCSHTLSGYQPAILRGSLLPDKAAVMLCAENNVPYMVLDSTWAGTLNDEGFKVHEMTHVRQALAYRGGCWPFVYRYRADSAFRVKVETEAYCEWGRWMIERNKVPSEIWHYIRSTMRERYGASLLHNCLYEETP